MTFVELIDRRITLVYAIFLFDWNADDADNADLRGFFFINHKKICENQRYLRHPRSNQVYCSAQ